MLVLLGSFAPLHNGHLRMCSYAEKMTGEECLFCISTNNADKGVLSNAEANKRIGQFKDIGRKCYTTPEKTFVAMATSWRDVMSLDEDIIFAVGIDTILRVNDPKYTFGSEGLELVLDRLANLKVRFLICERNGLTFQDLPDRIHPKLLKICENCVGYWDGGESSTALRAESGK